MKYYLVALFDEESYKYIEEVQRTVCRKYRLYKDSAAPHITLEIIGDPNIEKLAQVLFDVLKPYKRFKVEMRNGLSVEPPYKSVNLKVESKGYISRLIRNINHKLRLNGFEVRPENDKSDIFISLANSNHPIKEWNNEHAAASEASKKENIYKFVRVDRIELWKAVSGKREMVVKSFPLKTF